MSYLKEDIPDVLTHGEMGQGFKVDVFNVLGAGDAFLQRVFEWLVAEASQRANVVVWRMHAVQLSFRVMACAPAMPTADELDFFLNAPQGYEACLIDGSLDQIHWSTTRRNDLQGVICIRDRSSLPDSRISRHKANAEKQRDILKAKELAFRGL